MKGRCETCGKTKDDLREVLRNGPRGYRRYAMCAGCRSKSTMASADLFSARGKVNSVPVLSSNTDEATGPSAQMQKDTALRVPPDGSATLRNPGGQSGMDLAE